MEPPQINTVRRLIHNAHFAAATAAVEKIACYEGRKLDKAQMLHFSACKFAEEDHRIILKALPAKARSVRPGKRNLPPFQEGPICPYAGASR